MRKIFILYALAFGLVTAAAANVTATAMQAQITVAETTK
jgi:hypothetical protein